MTSTPTAIRPYSAVVSERSSSTLTTNTVEENDSANPTSASAPNDSPATKPNPITASRPRKPSAIATLIARCTTVVSQISRRSSVRTSSFSPIAKSSRTTPKFAIGSR